MRRLSELPLSTPRIVTASSGAPRVVTLGGGHGQATLLRALKLLDCDITAIVSVADDGGCSGKLRAELGMAPPGDIRRCLVSLARDTDLAERFEERLTGGDEEGRCVGNLVIAEMCQDLGSLQRAVDWAAALLGCAGRVVPVAEQAGTLNVYDMVHGAITGEAAIEKLSGSALVAAVEGPDRASPGAVAAIEAADIVFMGPGSFIGSTLAVLTTADVAAHIARAPARRVLVKNASSERASGSGASMISLDDQERLLRDHLLIGSGGEMVSVELLAHHHEIARQDRDDGTIELRAPLLDTAGKVHDPTALSKAIAHHFGFRPRPAQAGAPLSPEAQTIFERYLVSARMRLAQRS